MAPRGIGTMFAMMIAGRLSNRVDARLLMGLGIGLLVWSLYAMTGWTPDVSERQLIITIMMQGAGIGFVFTPLNVLGFATLDPAPCIMMVMFSLLRNVGSSIGISVCSAMLAHNQQVLHAELGAFITPFERALQGGGAAGHLLDPRTAHGAQMLDGIINQQAQIIAYVDDYKMMMVVALSTLLLLLVMRGPRHAGAVPKGEAEHAAVID
jgi:DHA2 family multidrug resistance protein